VLVAERIVTAWRATPGQPTLSVGVAVSRPGGSGQDTLQRADAAVYAAKRAGRDRICVDETGDPPPPSRRLPGSPPHSALSWS
jgi:PleD family two-component response regulator